MADPFLNNSKAWIDELNYPIMNVALFASLDFSFIN